ncbi:MAG TPA: DNA recombination protein RmuC [Ignavibacteriales bacterium]|nr:DNA recombination protein RmuC [Ignavibacteriales bacterium]
MEIIYLIIGLVIGFVIAYFFLKSKKTISIEEANKLSEQINSLKVEAGSFSKHIKLLEEDKLSLLSELKSEREKSEKLTSENSSLRSDHTNLQEKLSEQKSEVEKLQEKFTKEFENLANKIFEEKGNRFTEQNKEKLNEIINPLREQINKFEQKVEETNKESIKGHASLKEQLSNLKDLNQQMSLDAQNLVKALKGDAKIQGDWGEIQLELILEKSGLRKGIEYTIQDSITTDEGRKRTDVIVHLPENKKIIIDSKVSLPSYTRIVSAEDEKEQIIHIKSLVESVRKHLKSLSERRYQELFDEKSLDFVLMFIPIEPAFLLAIQYGDNLYVEAYDKNIIIVSPTTLLATLRTIANIWKQEYQNKNVLDIAKQAGALYDKFVNFYNDLVDVGKKLESAKDSYENAMKKIHDGKGNLISGVEKMKQLGAKASKSLPPAALNRADIDDENNFLDN